MSVVAARIYPDGFEIASDSIKVRWSTQTTTNSKFTKLWEAGPLVIGTVGDCQEAALMRLFSDNHQPETADERGMVNFMAEFAVWKKARSEAFKLENAYLIGNGRRVFHVAGLFVEEVLTCESIGAGMDYALAAMHCGAGVVQAVQAAIELSVYCAAPVVAVTRRG